MYGTLKGIFGLVVLRLIKLDTAHIFYTLMAHELLEDPHDIFISTVGPLVEKISSHSNYFLAAYLMFWAAIDIFLSVSLLRNKLWAYNVAFAVIGLFVLYEIYRFSHTHSVVLAVVILIDIAILWFIKRERRLRIATSFPLSPDISIT